jgi:hypothetical protein
MEAIAPKVDKSGEAFGEIVTTVIELSLQCDKYNYN